MPSRITGFDHVLVAVRDLEAAKAAWERLGFTATPRGEHAEWGTANHCLMLAGGYVELIAATGEGPGARKVRAHLEARGEGLMGLALATDDAKGLFDDLQAVGLVPEDVRSLSRAFEGETLKFRVFGIDPQDTPGVPLMACQHLTPDALRRPRWMAHPNGAAGLVSVTAVVDEPERHTLAYERVFGPGTVTPTDDVITVHSRAGLIFLSRPDDIDQLHTDIDMDDPPEAPSMVVLTLRVADADAAAALLKQRGVYFTRDMDGTVRIPADETTGVHLELVRG